MIILQGKHNEAIVYTNVIDATTQAQIIELCNQEFVADNKIRIMPDVHAGKGCTIGTTMTMHGKVSPSHVGVDIGCGVSVIELGRVNMDLKKLDRIVHSIPSGYEVRKEPHGYSEQIEADLLKLKCLKSVNLNRAMLSVGSLGGGNHFVELAEKKEGLIFLIVHSGSRYLGKQVAEYYQDMAYRKLECSSVNKEAIIKRMKAEERQHDIENALKVMPKSGTKIKKEHAYIEDNDYKNYLHDMKIVQNYATINRSAMLSDIVKGMKLKPLHGWQTVHNYIDVKSEIMRKGAISAQAGEKMIIPINMRDGSIIAIGRGNHRWNYSAPHGAGRLMSRSQAKATISLEKFKSEMNGIYSTSVMLSTLDESPMAYKPIQEILKNINDTVIVIDIIKPVYNFKAH